MTYPVWSYWEGPRKPWIEACFATMRQHIPQVQILDQFSWLKLRPLCDPAPTINLDHLAPNHRSDYIRVALLLTYGGWWIDADTLVMRNMDKLLNRLDKHEVVCPRDGFGFLLPGFLGCRAGSEIMKRMRLYQEHICRCWGYVDWGALMVDPLTRVVDDDIDRLWEPPMSDVMPIDLDDQLIFDAVPGDGWPEMRKKWGRPYCFMMSHNTLKKYDLTRPGTVFSRLYSEAMT